MVHADPIFKDLHVLPIDKLIHNRIGVFMYKIFYKLQPTIINNMYTQNLNVHTHSLILDKNILRMYQQEVGIFTQKAFIAPVY